MTASLAGGSRVLPDSSSAGEQGVAGHFVLGKSGDIPGAVMGVPNLPHHKTRESLKDFSASTEVEGLRSLGERFVLLTASLDLNLRKRLQSVFRDGGEIVEAIADLGRKAEKPDVDASVLGLIAKEIIGQRLFLSSAMLMKGAQREIIVSKINKPAIEHVPEALRESVRHSFNELAALAQSMRREVLSKIEATRQSKEARSPIPVMPASPELKVPERAATPIEIRSPITLAPTTSAPAAGRVSSQPVRRLTTIDDLSARVGPLSSELKGAINRAASCCLRGKMNRTMHPKDDLNDWQIASYHEASARGLPTVLSQNPAERILSFMSFHGRAASGTNSRLEGAGQLRFARGLILVDADQIAESSVEKPKDFRAKAASAIATWWNRTPQVQEPHAALTITFIPPKAIDELGPTFKRIDQRAFLASLTILSPKAVIPEINRLLGKDDAGRGALFAAVMDPTASNDATRDAIEKIKHGIVYPLARHLAGLPQDTEEGKIPSKAVMAAFGMFDVHQWSDDLKNGFFKKFIEDESRVSQ